MAWRPERRGQRREGIAAGMPLKRRRVTASISPSNTVTAGPLRKTGAPSPAQATDSSPPRADYPHRRIEQAAPDAGHHRRAGAGAAGQRFAGAAFVHAQLDMVAVEHLHEAGIDALRKARVMLDQRPGSRHRRRVDVVDHLHRVRVAHRHHRHQYASPPRQSIGSGHSVSRAFGHAVQAGGVERHRGRRRAPARPCRP